MKAEDINANRFVLDAKTTADLRVKLKNNPQGGLKEAAQQFESLMLQMMLKSMRDAAPQDGLMDSDQSRFYTSILDQQVAQNLSSQGKLGFAKLIEQQLGRNLPSGSPSFNNTSSLEAFQQSLMQRQAIIPSNHFSGGGAERLRNAPNPISSSTQSGSSAGDAGGNQGFVNRLWPHAVEAAHSLGVPPQFLVAHAALETGWGKSEIRTLSGQPSYNLFGVKAGRNWTGASAEVFTTEYVNGEAMLVREKFRVYGSYSEAFQDYANLLKNSSRFSALVGQQNGTQFARLLQQGGYATDPAYADKLDRIINGATLRQALSG